MKLGIGIKRRLPAWMLAVLMVLLLSVTAFAAYPAKTGMPEGDYTGTTVILHTNDVHGKIDGYAKLAALRDRFRQQGAEVILVDAGDFLQGDPYVNSDKGQSAIAMMNAVGYDLAVVGNHEFDYGVIRLEECLAMGTFQLLCANVLRNGETLLEPRCVYTTESGLRLGFFGLNTPETQTKANPKLTKGLTFLADETMARCAGEQVEALRQEGADLVIALTHLGVSGEAAPWNRSLDISRNVEGIDFFLDGHSHTVMTEGEDGEPIQSTGTRFQYIGAVVIDNATAQIKDHFLIPTEELPADPAVEAAAREIMDRVNQEMNQPMAYSEVELDGSRELNRTRETNSGDLYADALRWCVLNSIESLEVEPDHLIGLINGGAIRETIHVGEVTKKDVQTVHPFGDEICVTYVTGGQLLEILEASTFSTPDMVGGYPQTSGIRFTIDLTKEYDRGELYPNSTYYAPRSINRVSIQSVNGRPFSVEDTYALAVGDFLLEGGDTYALLRGNACVKTGVIIDECVTRFILQELDGIIPAAQYGEVRGDQWQITDHAPMPFADVKEDAWYASAVENVWRQGWMQGLAQREFGPEEPLTRGQFVTALWRMAGAPEAKTHSVFADVPPERWDAPGVCWAASEGLVQGYDGVRFGPEDPITREQMAAILFRFAREGDSGAWMFQLPYRDAGAVSDWAYEAVCWAVMQQIINGTEENTLSPGDCAARAQAAVILDRYAAWEASLLPAA